MEDLTQTEITLNRMAAEQMIDELEYYRHRRLLLDAIGDIAGIGYYEWCQRENRLLDCSREYAAIYDMTPEQILEAESTWERTLAGIHPDDRDAYEKICGNLAMSRSLEFEYRILRRDGEIRNVREISIIELDKHSGETKNFGILQDVTGMRDQRRQLEYREALAQQAESITEIGHFIYDEQLGVYKYISPGLAAIVGVSPEEYMERITNASADLNDIHPDDLPAVQAVYDKYDEDGETYSIEYRIFRTDGALRWVRERCITYRKEGERILESLGVMQDITEQKNTESKLMAATLKLRSTVHQLEREIETRRRAEEELEFLANHDALTGLPSLRSCMRQLEQSLAGADPENRPIYAMFVDLDGFKRINDRHGHAFGDRVLQVTADRIRAGIRDSDTAARIGGDEFLIIVRDVDDRRTVEEIATRLVASLAGEIREAEWVDTIGASIGIAQFPLDAADPESLIRAADSAMYRIKKQGKNGFSFSNGR